MIYTKWVHSCDHIVSHRHTSWTGSYHRGRDWRDKALLFPVGKLLLVKAASPRGEGSSRTTPDPGLRRKVGLRLVSCHHQNSTELR